MGWRGKAAVSLLGSVHLVRHYYHCRHCHRGFCPFDQTLGLTAQELTPAALEVVCLAGVQASFAEAAEKTLPKLAGVRLSEATVQRATEAAGRRLGEALAAGQTFGAAGDWPWHQDAEGKTVAYVSIDATGVGQQAAGGGPAEGRMAYVGMIYNPVPEQRPQWADPDRRHRPAGQARYLAGLDGLHALGEPLRRQGAQVGMDRAERWIALADGGRGLEDFLQTNFPRVEVVILDFYHVTTYLQDLAKAWHPNDAEAAQRLAGGWCHQLKHEGGRAVHAALQALDRRGRSAACREVYGRVLEYFGNQGHRMEYPYYRARGWQIGSGPVESACKGVVNARLCGPGMRWAEEGADAVCHLRALFRSEASQWEAFWNPSPN